MYENGSMIVLK